MSEHAFQSCVFSDVENDPSDDLPPHEIMLNLVRLRVAQIQECPTGISHYLSELHEAGESKSRLDRLESWPISLVFSNKERTALALAEVLAHPQPEESRLLPHLLRESQFVLSRSEIVQIVVTVEAMRDWREESIYG